MSKLYKYFCQKQRAFELRGPGYGVTDWHSIPGFEILTVLCKRLLSLRMWHHVA